jgi:hypothetical protein
LLFREGELIGATTGHDALLLRFDVDRGTSFDILPYGSERSLAARESPCEHASCSLLAR